MRKGASDSKSKASVGLEHIGLDPSQQSSMMQSETIEVNNARPKTNGYNSFPNFMRNSTGTENRPLSDDLKY